MIFLAIGSNLPSSFGDRFNNIDLAISFLKSHKIKLIKKSSYYETPSYPNMNNPKFINVVISINTNLSLSDLMSAIIIVEEKLERRRNKKNDPRTCDIDIIDYNKEIHDINHEGNNIVVPHSRLAYRSFVLIPLQEISPQWKHPKTKEIIGDIISNLSLKDKKFILKLNKK